MTFHPSQIFALLTVMDNSLKQRKALVLRTPVGFPARNLEQRLVELECSAQREKSRGKVLAFGIRCCAILACDIKIFCPKITRHSSWSRKKIGREGHARSVTLWWGALEINEAFHSKHPTRSSAGTEREWVNASILAALTMTSFLSVHCHRFHKSSTSQCLRDLQISF